MAITTTMFYFISYSVAIKWVYIVCVGRCSQQARTHTHTSICTHYLYIYMYQKTILSVRQRVSAIDTFQRAHFTSHIYVFFALCVQFAQIIFYFCFLLVFVGFNCTCYQIYWHYIIIKRQASVTQRRGNNSRQVVMKKENKRKSRRRSSSTWKW